MVKKFSQKELNQQGMDYVSDAFTNERAYLYEYRYRMVRERMVGPSVLEVGVGNADITSWLSEDGSFEVVSIDGSAPVLDNAVRKVSCSDRVTFVRTYFEEFDSRQRFDDILVTNSLEHVADPVALLKHMEQFLRPAGSLHITVPNARSLHRMLGAEMGLLVHEEALNEYDIRVGHQRVYTTELLKEHVAAVPFKVADQDGILLKPLADAQMNTLASIYGKEILEGLFALGRRLPHLAAEIYVCCKRP